MRLFTVFLAFLITLTAFASDTIITDGLSGNNQLVDSTGDRWNTMLAYTTNGSGDIITLGGLLASSDDLIGDGMSGNHQLIDNLARRWDSMVLYTTDGNGHVIPIAPGVSSIGVTSPIASTGGTSPTLSLLNVPVILSGVPAATKKLYVDGNRSDSYTQDGSLSRPFKTIMGAVNQVISNNDNATIPYLIDVAPAIYAEDVQLNNAALHLLYFEGHGAASIQPASGDAITSTSANDQLTSLQFTGFTIQGTVTLTGASNGTNFLSSLGNFVNDTFFNDIVANNVGSVLLYDSKSFANMSLTNVALGLLSGGDGQAPGQTMSIVTAVGNQPSGFGESIMLVEKTIAGADMTCGAGSLCLWREAARVGYPGGSITCSGTCQAYSSFFRSTVTVPAGGVFQDLGSFYAGAITNSGGSVSENGGVFKLLVNGASEVVNAALSIKDGHVQSQQTTAPTAAAQAGAGTSAACSVSNATDNAGHLSLTIGTAAFAAGAQCTVSFNKSFVVAPIVLISPTNDQAAADSGSAHHIYVSSTTGGFSVNFGVQPNSAGAVYTWNYHVLETQ